MITILIYAIFVRVILSWFGPKLSPTSNKLVSALYDVTDPILKPFRRFQFGNSALPVDFSPIFAIFALNIVQWLVWKIF
ncbi:YggT family protein [Desulfosporosinus shakirovi]|uniref:YggT family protein n=1 Tax=Desulfosporosinus shakirovi TaxID=2885154 RepID=UPI002898FAFA|nr:YggT family protein [Desulfosporosinus sp. SRJS8]MCB8814050.1 YggT family protein [Desulfosporosinus sp. SRJS8]